MMKSEKVSLAFARFRRSDEGQTILEYYNNRLAEMDRGSRRLVGDRLLIENGKRINLEEMITDLVDAEKVLGRVQRPKMKGVVV